MRENAQVEFGCLLHLRAQGSVAVDAMHGEIAGIIVGIERIRAGGVHAGVYRALRQHRRLAMHLQCAARIHPCSGEAMHLARIGCVAGCGVGAGDIQNLPRRVFWTGPHILNIGGKN